MNTASSEGVTAIFAGGWIHVDLDVGRAGGKIEAGDGIVTMQQCGDFVHWRAHAGDIGSGGKGANAHPVLVGRVPQQSFKVCEVDRALNVEFDFDMLARPSRQVTSLEWCSYGPTKTTG